MFKQLIIFTIYNMFCSYTVTPRGTTPAEVIKQLRHIQLGHSYHDRFFPIRLARNFVTEGLCALITGAADSGFVIGGVGGGFRICYWGWGGGVDGVERMHTEASTGCGGVLHRGHTHLLRRSTKIT